MVAFGLVLCPPVPATGLVMASSPTLLMRLVASAYSIAQKAGTIVRRVIAEGDLGIVEKTCATDLQTRADRLAQLSICSSLARKFPRLTIIGEEDLPCEDVDQELIEDGQWEEVLRQPCPSQYSTVKEEDLVVWVDPLDGTKEYTEGLLDNVTVLIGIAYEGKAIAGVINQPYYNYQSNEKQKLREYRHEMKVRKRARVLAPLLGSKEAGTLWYQLVIAEPPYQFPPPVSPLRHLSLYHVPFCTLALPSFFFLSLAYALKYVATSRKLLSFVGSIQG
ncbi:3'(2'),5'-bisphosphate nucleotidase 1 isoform X2 [Desmodus rotundus]|uniref:3'(2'),5'-bisphosphate nucleotidase 1 isoform X2 n=1 Tax=Desmodus rotundus TaxID=9430 RepID=UPI0023818579|nr:3'(2'),5'-bisphosphate nucleotidase 1 isoform X2 [Desmodus rotundus]